MSGMRHQSQRSYGFLYAKSCQEGEVGPEGAAPKENSV